MKIVTGVGENAHVTPEEFRMIFEGTFGNNAYILDTGERMAPELVSNNLLKIKSGLMCDDEGNISSVDVYDEVELKNGTQGMKRIDLIVNRYTKNDETKIEKNEWICITGTPAASNPVVPAHITGSLRAGDLVKDIPFIKVHFDGLNITQIETLVSVTKNIKDLTTENEDRKNEIAQLNGNLQEAKDRTLSMSQYVWTNFQNHTTPKHFFTDKPTYSGISAVSWGSNFANLPRDASGLIYGILYQSEVSPYAQYVCQIFFSLVDGKIYYRIASDGDSPYGNFSVH